MFKSKSFTLIEVLVFISILSLFFVAAMTVATFSLKNMKSSEYKILATHLAEQGISWVRSEKEADWSIFTGHGSLSGITYCLNTLDSLVWNSPNPLICNYDLGSPAIFKRELILTNQSGNPVTTTDVEITVSWQEGTIENKLPVKTVLKVWE